MSNIFKTFGLLIIILLTFSIDASAANRYFKSGATTWNSASSWSATSSAGADNAGVPTASDIAIFDSGSGSCSINVAVSCAGIDMNAGYLGVITQGAFTVTVGASGYLHAGGSFVGSSSSKTFNGAFTLSGGSFNGSTSAMTVTGVFTLSAGTFTATSGVLTLASTNNISAGVFAHNNGTVTLTAAAVTIVSGNFYNLTLNNSSQILTVTNNAIVNNTLTTTALATINGSPIEVGGNLVFTDTSWNGSSKVLINGTGTQTNTGTGVCGVPLEINKSAGAFNLGANLTLLGTTSDLILTAGTVNCNTFSLTIPRNLVKTAGTISTGTGTFIFNGAATTIIDGNFYNLTLNNSALVATITNNTIVNNILTLTALATINGSPIEARANVVFTDTSWNGTSRVILNGSGTQTNTGTGVCGVPLEVNKSAGSFNLGANLTLLGTTSDLTLSAGTVNCSTFTVTIPRNLVNTAGTINTGTGTFIFNGATTAITSGSFYNLTLNNATLVATLTNNTIVNNIFTLTALATINGSSIEAKGNFVFTDAAWNGTSKIIANGTLDQAISGTGDVGDFEINKASGNLTFNSSVVVSRKWTHTAGNIVWNSNTVTANGATVTLASGSFYNLTLNNSSLVLTNSTNIIVNNTLTLTALATINGSPLEAKANLVFTDTSFNGTSKIIASGTGAQSTSGAGVCGVTLDINKSAGTFTLGANLTLLGATSDLNLIAGTLNCATFTLTVPRNFTQSGGSFLGGTNTNTINGALTVNAGTYTATSGNTTVPSGNITLAAGTFTHNNGTLLATGATSRTYNFNNNTINHFTISGTTTASILTFSTPVTINGKLIYSAATLNLTSGTITLLGDLSARGLSIGTANYTFSGTNNQTIDCNGTTGNIGSVTINKSGGTLNVTNTPIFIKNFTYTAGTVNWGTSTAKFGQVSTTNNPVITSNGLQYGNVEILTGTADTLTLTGDMIVNGTFNMNVANIINGSSFRLRGNITVTDVAQTGTANTVIDGTTDQTITGAGTLPGNGTAETIINKPSGSLTLLSNISFSNTGQDLRVVKGSINLNGFNLTVRDFYRVFDKMTLKGSETITVNLLTTPATTNPQFTISGTSSTIEYIDSAVVANITKHAKSFYNLNLGAGKTHEIATGAGNGITVNGSFNSNGSTASRSVLRSLANASSTWQLNLIGTSSLTDKVDVKYSDASLGTAVSAIGSINSGNNTNWNFSLPTVTNITSLNANGSYKQGDMIQVQVTFSEPVVVTGIPNLTLETGTTDRTANYSSGSSTANLIFSYTVQTGDSVADLDYTTTTALALNGGTIKSIYNSNANLTLAAPGAAGSLGFNKNLAIYTFMATAQSVSLNEDASLNITLTSNYAGVNALTYSIVTPSANGVTVLSTGSVFTYTPTANYNGSDSFVFKANDGGDSLTATVSITVNPVNDAPSAQNQSITVIYNIANSLTLNNSDIENSPLTYTIEVQPTHGVLSVVGYSVSYTSTTNYYGPDVFTYHVNDGSLDSQAVTVNLFVDDAQEANDTSGTAKDITSILNTGGGILQMPNLLILANNEDWFTFTVTERSEIDLWFLFTPGNGDKDLDVYLYNSSLTQLNSGISGNPNEHIVNNDLPIGTYYIQVVGWAGSTNIYEMQLTRTTYDPDDRMEQNDTQGTAKNLTTDLINAGGQLFVNNLNIISNDDDFYKVTLTGTSNLIVDLSFVHANGNLALQVYNSVGTLLGTSNTATNTETLTLNSLAAGDYFIKAYGISGAQNAYSMIVQASVYISEDSYEPNDTKATAWDITSNIISGSLQINNLRLNSFNVDWFKFTIGTSADSNINVLFTPGNGEYDLDISLENSAGTILAEGLTGQPNENLTLNLAAGTYYLKVYGWSNAHNNYALNMLFDFGGNQAPTAFNQNISVFEDNQINITMTGQDPESQPITYSVVTNPLHGTLTGSGSTRTYTPVANYNGPDSFTFYVNDGVQSSANATINITVLPVNDAPVANSESLFSNGSSILYNVIANDTDIENNTLTIIAVSTPPFGTAVIENNQIRYTANVGFAGVDSFSYTISDGNLTASIEDTVTVNPPDYFPPVVQSVSIPSTQTTYYLGQSLDIVVTFDFDVAVTGLPKLNLNFQNGIKSATYTTGSGTNQIHFAYTVQAGDIAPSPMNYVDSNSLILNGGTMTNSQSASVNADLTLPATNLQTSLLPELTTIDGLNPTLTLDIQGGDYNNFKKLHLVPQNITGGTLKVYYTLNGTTPTTSSAFVTSANGYEVLMNQNGTITAFASNGTVSSNMISATFTFTKIQITRLSGGLFGAKLPLNDNLTCYPLSENFYGTEYDRFDLNPNLTRLFGTEVVASGFKEVGTYNITAGSFTFTKSISSADLNLSSISAVLDITSLSGTSSISSFLYDSDATLINNYVFPITIDRIVNYNESDGFLNAVLNGMAVCENGNSTENFTLETSGYVEPGTMQEPLDSFVNTVDPLNSSIHSPIQVGIFYDWHYSSNGSWLDTSPTPIPKEFKLCRFAVDMAGNAKKILDANYSAVEEVNGPTGFVNWEALPEGYRITTSALSPTGAPLSIPPIGADHVAPCDLEQKLSQVAQELKQHLGTWPWGIENSSWSLQLGDYDTLSRSDYYAMPCTVYIEPAPIIEQTGLELITIDCGKIKVKFKDKTGGVTMFDAAQIQLLEYSGLIPTISGDIATFTISGLNPEDLPNSTSYTAIIPEAALTIFADLGNPTPCRPSPMTLTQKVKSGIIRNLDFVKCGISFEYEFKGDDVYEAVISIATTDFIMLNMENTNLTYSQFGNLVFIKVYKNKGSFNLGFSKIRNEELTPHHTVTVSINLPGCNSKKTEEYSTNECGCKNEDPDPNITSPTPEESENSGGNGTEIERVDLDTPANGNLNPGTVPITNKADPITSTTSDSSGRVTSVTLANGGQITYQYNDVSKILTETNEVNTTIQYQYDPSFTRVIKKTIAGGAKGYAYAYNSSGKLTTVTTLQNDVPVYSKTNEYNGSNQITKTNYPDGTFEEWAYTANTITHTDKFGNISTKTFDSEKRLISEVSPSGSVVYDYAPVATLETRLVGVINYNPEGGVIKYLKKVYSAQGNLMANEYRLSLNINEAPYLKENIDYNGDIISTEYLRDGVNQTQIGTAYTYNSDGYIQTETAPDLGVTSYTYYATGSLSGLVKTETNPYNKTIYYEYNLNRKVTKVYGNTSRPGISTYTNAGDLLTFECKQFNPATQTFGPTHYKEIYSYMGTLLLSKRTEHPTDTAQFIEEKYEYDFLGRKKIYTDPNGVKTKYEYNSMDNVTKVITDYGTSSNNLNITTEYTYTTKGLLEDTIHEGKRTRNVYDSFGRLTSVIQDPLGLNITQVSYNYDTQWRQKTMTDAMGNTTTYNYNQLGQQYQTVNALGVVSESVFDGAGNVIRQIQDKGTGKLNATTEFFSDNMGRQFKTVSAVGQTYQREDRVEFDLNGNTVKQIEDYGAGKLNRVTVFELDDLGNQTKVTLDPDAPAYTGLKISNQSAYNEIGQLISTTAPNGLVTQYNYNYLGRQTSTVVDPTGLAITNSAIFDNNGNVTQTTDAGGLVVTMVYDALSRQGTQTVDPGGKNIISKTFYNRDGSVDKTINPEGVITKNIYNTIGLRTSTIVDQGVTNITTQFEYNLAGNITTIIDPLTKTATRGYDTLHRSIASTDAKGNITRVVYDNLNRPIISTDALGVQTVTNYNLLNQVTSQTIDPTGLNQTTSMLYDSLGRTTTVTKANGVQEVFEFDLADRKTKTIEDPTGLNIITNYEFNSLGQMTKVIDAKNKATQYAYNSLGQLTTETYADAGVKSYTYNSIGQRITQTDQNNNQFGYLYDNLYRLTTVNVTPGVGVGGTTQQVFTYDNMSRLTNAKDITSTTTNEVARVYNTLGRLTTETQKIGATTKVVSKQYNLVGRVNQLTYPTGRVNTYTFDNNHLPNTIVSNSTTVATYTFNGVNAPVTKTLGNNVSLNIEYNNRYQITKHDWKKSGVTITGFNYGHDSVGNRIWSENLATSNKSELFNFDNADRLTNFKTGTLNANKDNIVTPTYTQGWTLDQIGNWSQFNDNGSNSTNTFSNTHEMTLFKGTTQTFDNNGNLTFDGVRTFKYDAFNRIIEVKIGAVILAQYQYDAFNRRVMKKVDADLNSTFETTVKFLYDGFRCIEELNASDALTKEYVYGSLYIDEVILQRTGATDYYLTHDYRYSVTSLTNTAGNIVESYDYKVYGERTASGSGLTDVGYTGQRHDVETGLMYFKNRYYSTSMGSFVTRDPLGYIDGLSMYLGYFGADGRDPEGQYQEDGHFYTTFLVASAAGIGADEAFELAYFSQYPDEVSKFDAIGSLVGNILWPFGGATQYRRDIQQVLHSLHGGNAEEVKKRRACLKKMLMDKSLNLETWEKGLIIHAFADSYAHTKADGSAYHSGSGHAKDGTSPDIITNRPDLYKEYTKELFEALGGTNYDTNSDMKKVNELVDGLVKKKSDSAQSKSNQIAFHDYYKGSDNYKLLNSDLKAYDPRKGKEVLGKKLDGGKWRKSKKDVQSLINKIKKYCDCK